jgi:predicted alpha/beta hydrolase family esterase
MLKATAVAAVGAGAVATTTGPSVADTDQIMEVDFRGGTPPISDAPQGEDEVLFSIHGYTGSSQSVSQSRTLQQTARGQGYQETVTAVTWDDSGFAGAAESSARETGGRFATWMDDYLSANPSTNIRIVGHSMGGIVTMEMIAAIDGSYEVENADFIGSYEVSDAPCEGSSYFDAIESSCRHMGNYYSTNDSIARLGAGPAECGGGGGGWWGGGGGGGGTTASNYSDYDCTASVSSHTDYKASPGCVSQIISNFNADIDRGGSGGSDGGSGGSDGGSTDGGSTDGGSTDGGTGGWW